MSDAFIEINVLKSVDAEEVHEIAFIFAHDGDDDSLFIIEEFAEGFVLNFFEWLDIVLGNFYEFSK